MGKKIALDNGHGLETAGKRTPNFTDGTVSSYTGKSYMHEWEFNRRTVELLKVELERCGFEVVELSPTEADTNLNERVRLANASRVDFVLSIHANALSGSWGAAKGIETLTYETGESLRIGKILQKSLVSATGLVDRGIKDGTWLAILKGTVPPAVLVECGFMDNLDEAHKLVTEDYRKTCAVALAKGLCEAFKVSYVPEASPAPQSPSVPTVVNAIQYETYAGTRVAWIKLAPGTYVGDFVYKKGAKTSELVKMRGADFGINFPYFYDGITIGDAEDNDVITSEAYTGSKMLKWHEFAIVDGKPIIGQVDKAGFQDFLVQGAPLLIEDGNPCWDWYREQEEVPDDIGKSRAQRTAVGLDAEGNLLIVVADGREGGASASPGFTLAELTAFLKSKGAVQALNGDGGSSSVLATQAGSLMQNKGALERVTHHAVMFTLLPPASEAPAPYDYGKELVKQVAAKGYITDVAYWEDVIEGRQQPTAVNVQYLFEKIIGIRA